MRKRWPGLVLGILLLATAPGCRVLAGAAVLVGDVLIEGALDNALDDDDHDSCKESKRKHHDTGPRRAPAAPRDPYR